jgi:hypothetical protein
LLKLLENEKKTVFITTRDERKEKKKPAFLTKMEGKFTVYMVFFFQVSKPNKTKKTKDSRSKISEWVRKFLLNFLLYLSPALPKGLSVAPTLEANCARLISEPPFHNPPVLSPQEHRPEKLVYPLICESKNMFKNLDRKRREHNTKKLLKKG